MVVVQRGDLASQQRMPGRFGVAELEAVPQRRVSSSARASSSAIGNASTSEAHRRCSTANSQRAKIALEGEVGDAHRPMMAHDAGHGSTHRHRRRADRARRPPGRDGDARRPGCASSGWSAALRARPGLARRRDPRCRRPADRPRVRGRTTTRGRRTGPGSASSCRASGTSWRRRSAATRPRRRRATARPRRRLHGPRRRDGRPPARPTRATPGDRLVRRPRRLQHARHDAVGQRLGHALRDALRPRRPGPRGGRRRPDGRWSRTRRSSAGRSSTRRSRGCSPRRGSPTSGPGCSGRRPARGARRLGAQRSAREVDGIYIAFDLDCLDAAGGWARDDAGARRAVAARPRSRPRSGRSPRRCPVVGFGATAVTLANGDGPKTVDAIAQLAEAAFARRVIPCGGASGGLDRQPHEAGVDAEHVADPIGAEDVRRAARRRRSGLHRGPPAAGRSERRAPGRGAPR